jgi:hypothetical protein
MGRRRRLEKRMPLRLGPTSACSAAQSGVNPFGETRRLAPHACGPGSRNSPVAGSKDVDKNESRGRKTVPKGSSRSEGCVKISSAMQIQVQSYDPRVRAVAKQQSRADDEQALMQGQDSVAQLKRENEVFAPLARAAQADLSASRSLS